MNKWISINSVQPLLWTLFLFTDVPFHIFLSFSLVSTSPLFVDGDMNVWKEGVRMKCVKGMRKKRNERERMKKQWGEKSKVKEEEKRHHTIIFPLSEGEEERKNEEQRGIQRMRINPTNTKEHICGWISSCKTELLTSVSSLNVHFSCLVMESSVLILWRGKLGIQTQNEEITFAKYHTLFLFISVNIVEEEQRPDEEHKHQ